MSKETKKMPDQAVAQQVQEMFDKLLGDKAEAKAYSENPEAWLETNGYSGLSGEAVAECGVGYGSGASASSGGGVASQPGSYSPGVAGVAQAIDPVVYNTYIEDNSITNNIANNGYLDFEQQVVQGDGNVVAGDDLYNSGQIQTGDGQQAGDGGVNVGGDVEDSQLQTGDGIQAGDDVDISGSNVETGEGDQSVDQSVDQSTNIDDHSDNSTNVDDHSTNVETNVDTSVDTGLF